MNMTQAERFYWDRAMGELLHAQGSIGEDDYGMATATDDDLLLWVDDLRARVGLKGLAEMEDALRSYIIVRDPEGDDDHYNGHRDYLIEAAEGR